MVPLFALTLTVFIGALVLGVDLNYLRTQAENAQRVANAAALAGVVFLPDYPQNAYYRAYEEARKNGFSTNATTGVAVDAKTVTGRSNRLRVTITERVSLPFAGALGLKLKSISRSATAEFALPIETGAPDNVLGYAPFPTTLVNPRAPENFYLENKGPYTFKESGDAYTPPFESFNHFRYTTASGGGADLPNPATNPCNTIAGSTSPATTDGNCNFTSGASTVSTTPNLDNTSSGSSGFQGYDYIIDDPVPNNTLIVKLFDPFDENSYNDAAKAWDSTHATFYAPYNSTNSALGSDSTNCTFRVGANCSKFIDQDSTSSQFGSHPVTLEFSLFGPGISAYDQNMKQVNTLTTNSACFSASPPAACVIQAPFDAGNDPTKCDSTTCSPSPYAYRFLNYAIIHGPGIFRLNVRSVANNMPSIDTQEGTRGNAYGIAICGTGGTTPSFGDPLSSVGPAGNLLTRANANVANTSATADPYTNSPAAATDDAMGWRSSSCLNPNATANGGFCPRPANPTPADHLAGLDKCIHIYGLGKMAIHNWLSAGDSLIPLGFVSKDYANKTLTVRLYDIGDVSGGPNDIRVLTPAGDLSHYDGSANGGFTSQLPYHYFAGPDDAIACKGGCDPAKIGYALKSDTSVNGPPGPPPLSAPLSAIDVTGGAYNGSWLNLTMQIPDSTTYNGMIDTFGGYWKVRYHVTGVADDATTWLIAVNGSPVHLVDDNS